MEAISIKGNTLNDKDAARATLRELLDRAVSDSIKLRAAELLLVYSQPSTQ